MHDFARLLSLFEVLTLLAFFFVSLRVSFLDFLIVSLFLNFIPSDVEGFCKTRGDVFLLLLPSFKRGRSCEVAPWIYSASPLFRMTFLAL